jgi:hypothetical protein
MRPSLIVIPVLIALTAPARSQEVTPVPAPSEPPPPPSTPPSQPIREPAAQPAPQVFDREQPPSSRPTTLRRTVTTEVPPPASVGFGLELATSGLGSGNLQGGLLLGVHLSGGSIVGVRLDFANASTTVGSTTRSQTDLAVGLAARLTLAGSHDGFDLALGIDASFVKAQLSGPMEDPLADASGYRLGVGPQLRYWIHHNLALGYLAQLSYLSVTSDKTVGGSPYEELGKIQQQKLAFLGAFTLTAGF